MISFGLIQWLYLNIFRPVCDVLTFFLLHPYLYQDPWVIGAAITMGYLLYPYPHRKALRDLPLGLPFWWSGMFIYLLLLRHGLFLTLAVFTLSKLFIQLLVPHLLKPEKRQPDSQEERHHVDGSSPA
jgi:hypothetical protein